MGHWDRELAIRAPAGVTFFSWSAFCILRVPKAGIPNPRGVACLALHQRRWIGCIGDREAVIGSKTLSVVVNQGFEIVPTTLRGGRS